MVVSVEIRQTIWCIVTTGRFQIVPTVSISVDILYQTAECRFHASLSEADPDVWVSQG